MANRTTQYRSDAQLLSFADNFDGLVGPSPETYGLTAQQAGDLHVKVIEFQAASSRSSEPTTRTAVAVADKNTKRDALRVELRRLISIIDGQADVSEAQRVALGLPNRDRNPTPVPRPSTAPTIDILSAVGNGVTIRLHDAVGGRRGKVPGAIGATVFSFVGATPPIEESAWTFEGNLSKTTERIDFDQSLPPGTKVWFTAFWYNRRAQSGPPAAPVSANLPGGTAMAA